MQRRKERKVINCGSVEDFGRGSGHDREGEDERRASLKSRTGAKIGVTAGSLVNKGGKNM